MLYEKLQGVDSFLITPLKPQFTKHPAVEFPVYLKFTSPVLAKVGKETTVPYSNSFLRLLKVLVEKLPHSARDVNGETVSAWKINRQTIFVHSVLKQEVQLSTTHIKSEELGQLFQAAYELRIIPLIGALASLIADRIHPIKVNIESDLMQHGMPNFSNHEKSYVQKYLALKDLGIEEFTIADYIGLHGQPKQNNMWERD